MEKIHLPEIKQHRNHTLDHEKKLSIRIPTIVQAILKLESKRTGNDGIKTKTEASQAYKARKIYWSL